MEFGLIAWLEETRIALPLKGVECRVEVTGAVASVELDQIYHQNAARPLDCTYAFPLPAGAAVYRCELHVNGRVIRAKVEEREVARQIYREQKAAGRRAALVETERENLFTLSLGNVQPEDVIVVRFAWFQELDRAGDTLRLLIPTCPGVRYIPGKPLLRELSGRGVVDDTDQVPDASRITPPRIDAMHPDAAYFSMQGRLSGSDVEPGSLSSPSHPIYVRENADVVTVGFAGNDSIPDRDLVLCWREPKALELGSRAWYWRENGDTYALVQLRAPEEVSVAEEWSQDFYFLVDRSGSMRGLKWTRTCEALRSFVGLLGSRDRVWITLFESDFRDFAEAPLPASEVLADGGFQRMETLGTGGGTELLPAAKHVMEEIRKHSAGKRAAVILITDGEVGNETEILQLFRDACNITVHSFGIDTTVNDAFLKALSRQHRGGCWLQTPNDDIAGTIASLADRLRRPVLTSISVAGSWEIAGVTCPDLHAREVVLLALRGAAEDCIEIRSRLPGGAEHRIALSSTAKGSEAMRLLWAREHIAALLGTGQRAEAIATAKKHNLICEGAAFIAWDEAEQVRVAKDEIVQPAMAPLFAKACNRPILGADKPDGIRFCLSRSRSYGDRRAAAAMPFETELLSLTDETIEIARRTLGELKIPQTIIDRLIGSIASRGWASIKRTRMRAFLTLLRPRGRDRLRFRRANGLLEAAGTVQQFGPLPTSPCLREALDRAFLKALNGSPDRLQGWSEDLEDLVAIVRSWWERLIQAGMPESQIDRLFAWVLESGTIDMKRLSKIWAFLNSLELLPFSAGSWSNHWQRFLAETIGAPPELPRR